jgi:acyl dehydratase
MGDSDAVEPELETVRFPVDRSKVAELARAFGDDDPAWFDGKAALEAGFEGEPTQPTITALVDHWREGGAIAHAQALELDLARVLHGEAAWEYLTPVRVGDSLTAESKVTGRTTRAGKRGGLMTFITVETNFTNQRGEAAVRRSDTIIETGETK